MLQLRVAALGAQALDVVRVELVDPAGAPLPAFEPGAHVVLHLPGKLQRQYSLAGDWRDLSRYVLGVGLPAQSRGGSRHVHQQLRVGDTVACSPPANHFPLVPDAMDYLFIAGGIGITPLLSMARWCQAVGKPWRLVHAARSRVRLAFYEEMRALGGETVWHCDDEQGAPLAVQTLMSEVMPGTHVYCCGPAPLMEAVQAYGAHLPAGTLHFEWFSAPAADAASAGEAGGGSFSIELQRSGVTLRVPPDRSILEVLEQHGHEVPYSCREGLCGTCEVGLCEGEPDHRDYVYPPDQRGQLRSLLVCVSRARSPRLVLDL